MPSWHNLVLRKTGNLVSSRISRFKSGRRRTIFNMKTKNILIIGIFLMIFLIGCSTDSIPENNVKITINNIEVIAEIADEKIETDTGLMLRDNLKN